MEEKISGAFLLSKEGNRDRKKSRIYWYFRTWVLNENNQKAIKCAIVTLSYVEFTEKEKKRRSHSTMPEHHSEVKK